MSLWLVESFTRTPELRERLRQMFALMGEEELTDLLEENAYLKAEVDRLKKQVNHQHRLMYAGWPL